MIECLFGLLLMALIAALALPGMRHVAGPAALRAIAYEIDALLRDERTSAGALHRVTGARLDALAGGLHSSVTGHAVSMPAGVSVRLLDAGGDAIRFYADGRSSGGGVLIQSAAARLLLVVSPDTGAVRLAVP